MPLPIPTSEPAAEGRYAREHAVAEAAARAAGAFIRAHAGGLAEADVRVKGTHDLLTFVDEGAERIVLGHLTAAFPADAILAEETAGSQRETAAVLRLTTGRQWVVDPLDGTTNFTRGVPPYAVSVALVEDGRPVVGVVYDVAHDELFAAVRGGGLTLDGRPASVSPTPTLDGALVATGVPFRDYRWLDGFLESLRRFALATRGVRRHGAAAVDLAWVACGRLDGYWEAGVSPWDAAAGVLLVEEGGGRVTGLPAGADAVWGGALVASNPHVHAAMVEAAGPLGRAWGERESGAS